MKSILLLSTWLLSLEAIACAPETPRLEVRGRWLLDSEGKPTPAAGFTRGLQTSGLVFRQGELWAIGDQRSRYPGHLYRIDPRRARLASRPLRLEVPSGSDGASPEFGVYAGIPNSDFEGVCADPLSPDTLFAVTEDKVPWLAQIRLTSGGTGEKAAIVRADFVSLTRLHFPRSFGSWRGDTNFRFEGITISDDGKTFYLAFERAHDELPRICRVRRDSLVDGEPVTPDVLDISFDTVPPRADKPGALLNINGIHFLRRDGVALLLAILRDQERLLLIDLDSGKIRATLDLLLLDPEGAAIKWVSPEGLTADSKKDRIWIINDPDSVRGNYRSRGTAAPAGHFADYTPLLFELKLSDTLSRLAFKGRRGSGDSKAPSS